MSCRDAKGIPPSPETKGTIHGWKLNSQNGSHESAMAGRYSMRGIVCITSLAVFFSAAAVNYAAAQSSYGDCDRQSAACYSHCPSTTGLSFSKALAAEMEGQRCRKDCANSGKRCYQAVYNAIEERKKITCYLAGGNVSRCVQHGRDLLGW
jgi:hypothetical protein